ncbi:transcriptional regulator [Cupriavidus sp. SHE]|jgi:transcriptional regulator with XRE-family HTH domain|uniref:XRE family transcriptional regulator n=1 Tax=Cupriavidus metallidurans TaxID=119219 RepID=A0A2L0XBD2_9BURK|nr:MULTISPECIES: helix-turn-helix transcriptional regulator [Cupriavidus]AVA37418.1 XRE family transcriptional regulator [Cupriavidus metallidurans]KWR85963.1 transcriptional regulator [Cupriavidus sp. SHE]QBP11426.1 XRE family transcriptional regulator [Cupriavidus metallidurans]
MTKRHAEPTTRELFARNVRALRRAKEISQEELAELAGLSRTYVSSVEREQRNISIDNIGKLAAALGTTPMALLDPDLASRLRGE